MAFIKESLWKLKVRVNFFKKMFKELEERKEGVEITTADFNMVMDEEKDKPN